MKNYIMFFVFFGNSVKASAMEESRGSVFLSADEADCGIHWIMIALTIVFFLYQAICSLLLEHRKVQVREFIPAGIYVVLMLVTLAFGNCAIDFFVMLSGVIIAIASVSITLIKYKRSVNRDLCASRSYMEHETNAGING